MIMGKLLEDLYNGRIQPIENYYEGVEECKEKRDIYHQHCDDFIKKVGESFKLEFNNILDEYGSLISTLNKTSLESTFSEGFRLGAKMVLEILEKE